MSCPNSEAKNGIDHNWVKKLPNGHRLSWWRCCWCQKRRKNRKTIGMLGQ